MTTQAKRQDLLRWANLLIYASVVLGILLVAQLYELMVPLALLIPIIVGWILYLIVAIMVRTRHEKAYIAALILAIITLGVSLPQPEHLSLAEAGITLASLTFLLGSILQAGLIVLVTYSLIIGKKDARSPKPQDPKKVDSLSPRS